MNKFDNKRLSVQEARDVQGNGWCTSAWTSGCKKIGPYKIPSFECKPYGENECEGRIGLEDKLCNARSYHNGDDWVVDCYVKYGYYGWGF